MVLTLLTINLWTLLLFWQDKRRAAGTKRTAARRRIPERRLLILALIGGSPAAFLARHLFRHKTRKQPFSAHLHLIACGQLFVLAAWLML